MKKSVFIYLNLILLFLIFNSITAQESEANSILSKLADSYAKKESYSLVMNYNFYRKCNKNKAYESYAANMYKQKDKINILFEEYEILIYDDIQLNIVNTKKEVYYTKVASQFNPNTLIQQLNVIKSLCFLTVSNQNNKTVTLEFIPKNQQTLPYSKIEVLINKADYSVVSQTLSFTNAVPFKEENGSTNYDTVCLEISMNSMDKSDHLIPDKKEIISFKQTEKPTLINKYSEYKLVDQQNAK